MPTKRQKQILNFITSFQKKKGFAPSLEEIKKHLKLSSVSTVHFHIKKLQDEGFLNKEENSPRSISVYESQQMVKIPLMGVISAGQPIEAIQVKETIAIPKTKVMKGGNFYALRVAGNSMIDENINDGDIVLVKEQQSAENGQKVVALIDNYEATLKTFYKERNQIRLQPANKDFEPIIIRNGEKEISIQGLVVDVIKNEILSPEIKAKFEVEKPLRKLAKLPINEIVCGDCIEGLKNFPTNSIDACITDPPYNYEFIGHKWNPEEIKRRTERVQNSKTLVKHIPYGSGLAGGVRNDRWYKKNAENVIDYQNWCFDWGKEVYRALKPGAYILVFNSSRTIAHVQIALEKAGFYTRDILVWKKNSGIPKGLNFSKKLEVEGEKDFKKWEGWHSCLRNEWEGIVMLQKPLINNYFETVKQFGVGLLHAHDGNNIGFQSNIIENIKRDSREDFNIHCTIKPQDLITKLIDLILPLEKSKIVLDPFMGSGTTALAAIKKGISFLGFEVNEEYCTIAKKRIEASAIKDKQRLF
jgi:site-specific DNA-methyltransferase (adenine-specific)